MSFSGINQNMRTWCLRSFWNDSWGWHEICNQIWLIDVGNYVRALCCFGDGQICPRKQCPGASKLSPYLYPSHRVQALQDKVPISLVLTLHRDGTARWSSTIHSKYVPWKAIKTIQRNLYKEEVTEGSGRSSSQALHPRAAYWSRVVVGSNPCNNTTARCSASWNVRNIPGSTLLLQSYCTKVQVCARVFDRDQVGTLSWHFIGL